MKLWLAVSFLPLTIAFGILQSYPKSPSASRLNRKLFMSDEPSDVENSSINDDSRPISKTFSTDPTNNESLFKKILLIAASSDRGQFASPSQKQKIQGWIKSIEDTSLGEENPTNSQKINGTWELLYSDTQLFRSSPFFMAGRAVCSTPEQAAQYDWFCDMHRTALAISEIGKVRQIICENRLVSEFETSVGAVPFLTDFTPFKYSGGLPFKIEGAIVSTADITPVLDGKAWEIFMDQVEIKGSNIPLLRRILDDERVALKSRDLGSVLEKSVAGYTNPKPLFYTTYLDDIFRISRDQDGKIFVYGKTSESTDATDYGAVESDLGFLRLLEGLNDNFFKLSI